LIAIFSTDSRAQAHFYPIGLMNTTRLPSYYVSGVAFLCSLAPSALLAHPGHYHPPGETDEFDALASGFYHPLSGMDHLLLALAAGWIAITLYRSRLWLPSLSFLAAILGGALAGRGAHGGWALELFLSITLLLAGITLLLPKARALTAAAACLAAVGFAHGFAHGAEAPQGSPFGVVMLGSFLATAALYVCGLYLGSVASRVPRKLAQRAAGSALITFGGIALLQIF
jgi:urease accessory protein